MRRSRDPDHWGRDIFALALAIQTLLWGIGQPFAGGSADRFGASRVLIAGALCYAAGLLLMTYSTTPLMLDLSAGALIGLGLSGCSFESRVEVLSASCCRKAGARCWRFRRRRSNRFVRTIPLFTDRRRADGPCRLADCAHDLRRRDAAGILPLATAFLATRQARRARPRRLRAMPAQSFLRQSMSEAFGHRTLMCLLVLGYAFTCGFQLAFVGRAPCRLIWIDRGLSAEVGGWTLAIIGLFNIIGSMTSGFLGTRMPKRYILSIIYFSRAVDRRVHLTADQHHDDADFRRRPPELLWLSTVPPTSALVAVMFGTSLARHAVRLCSSSQATRSVASSACCSAASCSSAGVPTIRCGGFRCSSA